MKGSKSLDRFKCKQQAVNETFIFVLAKEMKYLAYRHGLHTVMAITSQTVAIISFSARGGYFILRYQGRMLIGDKALIWTWSISF